MTTTSPTRRNADRGTVLPLVLVLSVVISVVVVSLATYMSTSLRYGGVVEERADRLASADGGVRYGVERIQTSTLTACMTNLGTTGYMIDFPVVLNDAPVTVTCTKASNIGDIKSWALVITGEGIPGTDWMLATQGAANTTKYVQGPVWMTDPTRTNFSSKFEIEDGDVWYEGADCTAPSPVLDPKFIISPANRGTLCVAQRWDDLFRTPPVGAFPPASDLVNTNPAPTMDGSCTVFSPGRYTVMPTLGNNNYFKSGNYYFQNVVFEVKSATVTAGWPDFNAHGDQQFLANAPCDHALSVDSVSGSDPGATFYLGGTSMIDVRSQGELEILRRRQGNSLVSVQALDTTIVPDQLASTLGYADKILFTESGNNLDLVVHGTFWAPRALVEFGGVTNIANGQLLGGVAAARVDLQASGSASKFVIRVENSRITNRLRVDATATKAGGSTTMRAIIAADDHGLTAVESIRVVD